MRTDPAASPAPQALVAPPRAYVFGAFRIEVASRTLRCRDEVVQLPSRAFDTLLYLVEHRDRLVPKDELVSAVWQTVVVTDDSLVHAISVVRRALADDPSEPRYVQTIPRRGYRFIAEAGVAPTEAGVAPTDAGVAPTEAGVAPTEAGIAPTEAVRSQADAGAPSGARALAAAGIRFTGIRARARQLLALTAVAAVVAAGTLLALSQRTPTEGESRTIRLFQPPPLGTSIVSGGALSPDGRYLAFAARDDADGKTALWLRTLTTSELKPIDGTEGASRPFWAPDGRRIGFFAKGSVMTVELNGGPPRAIAQVGLSPAGASWSADDTVLFADWRTGLYSVPAGGGDVTTVATLDRTVEDITVAWPQFLPDGRHFLYQVTSLDRGRTGVYVGNLDTLQSFRLLDSESPAVFAPPRYLLHVQRGMLIAEEFDLRTLELTGRATLLARGVAPPLASEDDMMSAGGGLLAFRQRSKEQRLAWLDRSGTVLGTLSTPVVLFNPRISPDQSHLLATSSLTSDPGLWLTSLTRAEFQRLETDGIAPLWAPDGERIAFTGRGGFDLYVRRLDTPAAEPLATSTTIMIVNDWSPDGAHIVYTELDEESNLDLWHVRVEDGVAAPLLATPFNEMQARISPDGQWLAYVSDESGVIEVYVTRYPDAGYKYRVSSGGGGQPQWRADQRELYYLAADRSLMAVDVAGTAEAISFGAARRLFRAPVGGDPDQARDYYAATADGARFLVDGAGEEWGDGAISVIVDWPAAIRAPRAEQRPVEHITAMRR